MTRTVLANGLTAVVKPTPGTGAVALHGLVKCGAMFDDARPGIARFVGSMLTHGTARRTAQQLAEDLDAMGANLTVIPGLEITTTAGRALQDDLPALLGAAAEVLTTPDFPADEVEKVRGQLLTAVRVNSLDTRYAAERLFRRLAYPGGHPHSRPPDGDEAVLAELSRADLGAFHRRHFRPEAAVVVVVGEIESGRAVDLIRQAFGEWPSSGTWALPRFAADGGVDGVRRAETHLPGKTQADLALGGPGITRTDPDYYSSMMANLLLGQLGMMGRIGESVRERQGMAYYAFSDLRAGLLAGPWWVRAGVNPANIDRAVGAILNEIRALQHDGPDADELADARRFLVGSLAVRLETSQGVAQILADIELYGLGLDYLQRYPSIIEGVRRDDIVAAIRRFPVDGHTLAIARPERS
ncbi:MAG: M16 family metallopeptidase [Armatimonadota bacterium]